MGYKVDNSLCCTSVDEMFNDFDIRKITFDDLFEDLKGYIVSAMCSQIALLSSLH